MLGVLKNLLEGLGLFCPQQSRIARSFFSREYPTWRVLETRTLASEPTRYVVAVFYEVPQQVSFPAQYRLFAVSNDLLSVQELPDDAESPYWIHGRK